MLKILFDSFIKNNFRKARRALVLAMLFWCATAYAQSPIHVNPQPGVVNELSEFLLTFDGDWSLGSRRSAKFTVTGPEGVTIPAVRSYSQGAGVGYLVYFENNAQITAPGTYTLTVPAGKFAINDIDLDETQFEYIIEESDVELYNGHVSFNPAPGAYHSIGMISLTFDEDVQVADPSAIAIIGPHGNVPLIFSTDGNTLGIVPDNADMMFTEAGTYNLTLQKGALAFGDKVNSLIRSTYEVDPGILPLYEITPSPGVHGTISHGFRLTFDTEEEITVAPARVVLYRGERTIKLFVESPTHMPYIDVLPVDNDGNPIVLNEPGDYLLIFQGSSIKINGVSMADPLPFNYTLTGDPEGEWTGQVEATPASGSYVESLKNIEVSFTGAASVNVVDNATHDQFPTLYNTQTNDEVCKATVYAHDNVLEISLNETVTAAGKYSLIIPGSLITVDGTHPQIDIDLHYTIDKKEVVIDYDYYFDPESGSIIGNETPITITFSGDDLDAVDANLFAWDDSAPHFTNQMGAYNPTLSVESYDGLSFTFSHYHSFEENGVYTLVIPAGYFTLINKDGDTALCDEIQATYTIATTKIDSIEATTGNDIIYNLSGVSVNADTNKLPPAIYIINGKKRLIK